MKLYVANLFAIKQNCKWSMIDLFFADDLDKATGIALSHCYRQWPLEDGYQQQTVSQAFAVNDELIRVAYEQMQSVEQSAKENP